MGRGECIFCGNWDLWPSEWLPSVEPLCPWRLLMLMPARTSTMSCARSAGLEVGTQTVVAACLQALWRSALPRNVRCSCRPLVSAQCPQLATPTRLELCLFANYDVLSLRGPSKVIHPRWALIEWAACSSCRVDVESMLSVWQFGHPPPPSHPHPLSSPRAHTGDLLCCSWCNLVFHLSCIGLTDTPEGVHE